MVYLAYHDYEVEPGEHIANCNVQLRMIPASGGEPQVLLEFFGGQGSLNVNSWSPDSTPNILKGLRESALYLRNAAN